MKTTGFLKKISDKPQMISASMLLFIPLIALSLGHSPTLAILTTATLSLALVFVFMPGRSMPIEVESVVLGLKEIEKGNLSARLEHSGNKEFDELIESFNNMASRLQDGESTIRGMRTELERRVAERTAQLASTNQELESFSYSVSHDLRAPLRHIDAYARIILEEHGRGFDAESLAYLHRIRRSTGKMTGLIEALLSMAGLARLDVYREVLDLSDLAHEIAAELRNSAPERQVDVIIQPGMTIHADARLIRIVMENLISNAWKYTGRKERGMIEVGCTEVEGKTAYFVRDNGAGFDMSYASKLFTAFQRLHTEKEFEGTGIGLTTVQRIIHRHLGRIWAESVPGIGATFWFTLN